MSVIHGKSGRPHDRLHVYSCMCMFMRINIHIYVYHYYFVVYVVVVHVMYTHMSYTSLYTCSICCCVILVYLIIIIIVSNILMCMDMCLFCPHALMYACMHACRHSIDTHVGIDVYIRPSSFARVQLTAGRTSKSDALVFRLKILASFPKSWAVFSAKKKENECKNGDWRWEFPFGVTTDLVKFVTK